MRLGLGIVSDLVFKVVGGFGSCHPHFDAVLPSGACEITPWVRVVMTVHYNDA